MWRGLVALHGAGLVATVSMLAVEGLPALPLKAAGTAFFLGLLSAFYAWGAGTGRDYALWLMSRQGKKLFEQQKTHTLRLERPHFTTNEASLHASIRRLMRESRRIRRSRRQVLRFSRLMHAVRLGLDMDGLATLQAAVLFLVAAGFLLASALAHDPSSAAVVVEVAKAG